jgi:hypothetical protein
MSAPRPYEDIPEPEALPSQPSWKCPEEICDCHPVEADETLSVVTLPILLKMHQVLSARGTTPP